MGKQTNARGAHALNARHARTRTHTHTHTYTHPFSWPHRVIQYLLLGRTCCILYQLPPLLLAIFWIFYGAGKDNRGRCADNPSGRYPIRTIGAPTSIIPFLCLMPFLLQPSQFILAWDRHRIMLACTASGLVQSCSKDVLNLKQHTCQNLDFTEARA